MADRRAKFESKFRNVWSTGATGVSYLSMTSEGDPSELISKLFKDTMIADEWTDLQVKRSYVKHGHQSFESDRRHLTFVTSDDRVAEVIEEVTAWYGEPKDGVPNDLVVTPLATGSKDYIEWVKLQTLKKDDSAAFFNDATSSALKPITTKVEDNAAVQTKVEETKDSKSLWSSDPEDDEEEE